jgi:hypothetical protein
VNTDAQFSSCRRYRYALWRVWNAHTPHVAFIGLNPSTADEAEDDPTIRRCMGFARHWGYGGLVMLNLFAFRATDPRDLLQAEDPIGPGNDRCLNTVVPTAAKIVAAWGNHGGHLGRSAVVRARWPELYALKINQSGEPAHPLYLPKGAVLVRLGV